MPSPLLIEQFAAPVRPRQSWDVRPDREREALLAERIRHANRLDPAMPNELLVRCSSLDFS